MASPSTLEVERKYDVDDAVVFPSLSGLAGVSAVDHPVEHHLSAEYFDTPDLRLASLRITLRRRTGGYDAGWHLKFPSGPDARLEFHAPFGPGSGGSAAHDGGPRGGADVGGPHEAVRKDTPEAVPEALLGLIRVHVRDAALVPVARLHTRRTIRRLHGPDGGALADAVDDHVRAETLVLEHAERRWREWDIELTGGTRGLLNVVQGAFLAAGARPSSSASKLERALGPHFPTGHRTPPVPRRKGAAGDVLLAYLGEQVRSLVEQDPLVREDAPDAVHKMRVATRRMRSTLATFRELLDGDAANRLRGELQWLAGVLGAARDTEVMHARLREMLASEPDTLVMGPVARRVDLELDAAYRDAHNAVLRALDGERYFRLLDALDAILVDPPFTSLAHKPALKVVSRVVTHDARRLRRAVRAWKVPAPPMEGPLGAAPREAAPQAAGPLEGADAADAALHEARKCAKRLRYAAEAAVPVGGKRAARLAEAAKRVQTVLGEHQDSVVTRGLLERLGAVAGAEGEDGFTYGRLHALEEGLASNAVASFRTQWKDFPSASLKK